MGGGVHGGEGGMHGGGHVWQGMCVVGGMHGRGACMVGAGEHAWQILRDTVNERAVRILLECILVYRCNTSRRNARLCDTYAPCFNH